MKKIIALVAGTAALTVRLAPPAYAGLISCSQPGPLGGALAGDGRQGSTRPATRPLLIAIDDLPKERDGGDDALGDLAEDGDAAGDGIHCSKVRRLNDVRCQLSACV